jgi:hypothetical protein
LYKVGKAHTGRVTAGLPTRLHQQVRKLRELYGDDAVKYILDRLGRTTTAQAKAAERLRLQSIYDKHGTIPPGNQKSFIPNQD